MKSKSIYLMYNKTPFYVYHFKQLWLKKGRNLTMFTNFISCFFSCKYSLIQTKNSFESRTKLRGIENQSFLNYYYCSAPLPTTLLQHWTEQAKSIFNHFPILLRNHFVFWKKKSCELFFFDFSLIFKKCIYTPETRFSERGCH